MSISSIGSGTSSVDYAEMRKKMAERMAERMMKDLDTDGDGAISKAELGKAKSAAESSTAADSSSSSIDDLFDAIDSGADGSISKDELISFVQKSEAKGGPKGPPPGGPPPGGPPPDEASASDESTEETSTTEETQVQNRQAFAYQQLMSLLRNLGEVTTSEGGISGVSTSG